MLVSIDGAGASHDVIDYFTSVNTAGVHGHRGRRVEYTIGWPLDERTMADADGNVDPAAYVADLTGIMRQGPAATGWRGGRRVCG